MVQIKVKTNITIYYPYNHNYISRIFLEKVYFPLFKSHHKFFIVTTKNKFPHLGYQQVLKIDHQDLPSLIQKQIQDRLYLQNNYLYFPNSKKYLPILILILFTTILIIYIAFFIVVSGCFPEPENYFNPHNFCQKLTYKNHILTYLLRSKMPPWVSYSQDTVLRQSLLKKLPWDKNPYYLDWLYANGIAYSPIYSDYLINQKNGSLDLSLLENTSPLKAISYELNYTDKKLTTTINIIFEKNVSKIINIKLPVDFVLQNILLNTIKLPSGSFWQKNQSLFIDTSVFTPQENELKLILDSNLNKNKQSLWGVYIQLPFNQTLVSHTLVINYPPDWLIIVRQKPHIARNGFLQYNLPVRGISKIDFNL